MLRLLPGSFAFEVVDLGLALHPGLPAGQRLKNTAKLPKRFRHCHQIIQQVNEDYTELYRHLNN